MFKKNVQTAHVILIPIPIVLALTCIPTKFL